MPVSQRVLNKRPSCQKLQFRSLIERFSNACRKKQYQTYYSTPPIIAGKDSAMNQSEYIPSYYLKRRGMRTKCKHRFWFFLNLDSSALLRLREESGVSTRVENGFFLYLVEKNGVRSFSQSPSVTIAMALLLSAVVLKLL